MVSVYQTVDTRHEDIIHDAQMNYYGTLLATCSSDETIKVFEVQKKKQHLVAELRGHQGPVWGLSWSHPIHGNLLASCSYDRSVIVWGEQDGKWQKIYVYSEHESSVNSVRWAPHEYGLLLACGSSDGSMSILNCTASGNWDVSKIGDAHSVGVNCVSWSPAISADLMLNPNINQTANSLVKRLVSGGCDSMVKIWREDNSLGGGRNWVLETCLEGHADWVRDVAWSPSLSLSRRLIASCGQDGRVIVWQSLRATAASELGSDSSTAWTMIPLHTYQDVVWHVSWSLTGNLLAVSGGDNKVNLWKENLEGNWICLSEISRGRQSSVYADNLGPKTGSTRDPLQSVTTQLSSNAARPIPTSQNVSATFENIT